jgi:hypothetical protein
MKQKYLIKKHKLPIYGGNIIYVEHTKSNFYDVLDIVCNRYGLNPETPEDLNLCHGLSYEYYKEGKGQCFYLFVNTDYKSEYLDTMCHEIYHMVQNIIKHFGIVEIRGEANEPVAYLTGYLSSLLINKKLVK